MSLQSGCDCLQCSMVRVTPLYFRMLSRLDALSWKAETTEIVSILGHELGHWKMSHTIQGFIITQTYLLASFSAFGLATEFSESLRLSFGYSTPTTLITLYLFFAVVSLKSQRWRASRVYCIAHHLCHLSLRPEGSRIEGFSFLSRHVYLYCSQMYKRAFIVSCLVRSR